uniref:HECT domain-containing protein n=1 Tax=Arcella intermedia TaxID=1963864 RepID=A0A6B2L0G6_9EUKA
MWKYLHKLGYDFHLDASHYLTFEEALERVSSAGDVNQTQQIDFQILALSESIFNDATEFNSPIQLNISHILPIQTTDPLNLQLYSQLIHLDLRTLRLRFEMVRQFNSSIDVVLPLVNLGNSQSYVTQKLLAFRELIFHSTKMRFFYDILDKTAVVCPQPTVSYNRLELADRNEKRDKHPPHLNAPPKNILLETAFGMAYSQLRTTDPRLFRQKKPLGTEPHFSILIDFKGEHVQGEGGPYRQFFTDVSRELQQGGLPFIIPCPNAQTKLGKNRDKFIASPNAKSDEELRMYRFLGQLMGMSVRTGVLMILDLPSFVWKPLLGRSLNSEDLHSIDQSFYGTLQFLKHCSKEDLEGKDRKFFEKFEISLSDKSTHLLIKNGNNMDVTYQNKDQYIKFAEAARLNESKLQLEAMRKGLCDIIPEPLLNLLTWQDLEWRVTGRPKIDIKLLKRHTEYSGVSENAHHIVFFWHVLHSFTQEERRAFIRFAWGQERLPATDLEFTRTGTRMLIKPYTGKGDPDAAFPKADTCFFNFMLPAYTSAEILKDRLLFAIRTDADSMNADQPQDDSQDSLW